MPNINTRPRVVADGPATPLIEGGSVVPNHRPLGGPSSRWLSTYLFFSRPLTSVPRWLERYGDPMRVPLIGADLVVTANPELIKQLFATNPNNLLPLKPPGSKALLGDGSVLQLTGPEHRDRRKLLMPPFHGKRMRHYAEVMHQTADTALRRACDSDEVLFRDVAQSITLDVILRTVFCVQEPDLLQTFKHAVAAFADSLSIPLMFTPFLHRKLGGLGPYARYLRASERLDTLLQEQIERSRRAGSRDDVLSMLLEARYDDGTTMNDEEVRNELTTLLFAGHETTATALCWAVDAIGRHPAVRHTLCDELRGLPPDPEPEALATLPYLDAVVKETLRLFPVATSITRVIATPMELGGHTLALGTVVVADGPAVHRREDLYPESEQFMPERFIGRKYSAFEYLPFGGGHRHCIGAAYANFEMQIVLGTLLGNFDVDLLRPRAPRAAWRNMVQAPDDGVPVRIRKLD